jgi:hypothetical protein
VLPQGNTFFTAVILKVFLFFNHTNQAHGQSTREIKKGLCGDEPGAAA